MPEMYNVRIPFPVWRARLKNGMRLLVVRRPGVLRKLALWSVPFGSLQQSLHLGTETTEIPAGMAHFLEHQLFREEDGNSISDRFAVLGVQENAFTHFEQTGYHFSGVGNFEAGLELLLRFTAQPCFTEASVAGEREIITQELLMYRDIPEAVLELNLRKALFGNHAAGEDIGGTPESIALATPELLRRCHAGFYHPQNAALVVIGDVDPQAVHELAERAYAEMQLPNTAPASGIVAAAAGLPAQAELSCSMNVARPLIAIGVKEPEPISDGRAMLRCQLESTMLLDLLLSKAAEGYWRLYRSGLINNTFHSDYQAAPSFAYAHLGGETERPAELVAAVRELLFQKPDLWIHEHDVDRLKRRTLGEFIGGFEGFDNLAFDLAAFEFIGIDIAELPTLLEGISVASLKRRAETLLKPEHLAVSMVTPRSL